MQKTKYVEFDLFRPYYLRKNEKGTFTESIYDLRALLSHVASNPLINTKKKILGDYQLFHVCRRDEERQVWEIQILHLRDQILPGIAREDGGYELIKIPESDYPAESTTLIYDEKEFILYVQRNVYGTSIRALTALLEEISPAKTAVNLRPIIQNSEINKVLAANKHKKMVLSIDTEEIPTEKESSELGEIISTFSKYQGRFIKVELGFGHSRGRFLNKEDTTKLLKEVYGLAGTKKLEVSILENEDSSVEIVDLLNDRKRFHIKMIYTRKDPITHDRLYNACLARI